MRSMPSASSRCSTTVSRSGLILLWEAFLEMAILPPRSESQGGGAAGGEPGSSPTEEADEVALGLAGLLGFLAGRAGALGLGVRTTGLLGWERLKEWVGEGAGDGEEGRDRGGCLRPLASRSLDFFAGTGGGTGGFFG